MPADGFLLVEEITSQSLEDSLLRLARGDMPVPALLSRWMLGRLRNGVPTRPERPFFLTARELETLLLLGRGYSNKQIARSLQISQHGAKRHVANVLAKLNCPNRTLAVALALRHGIIDAVDDEAAVT
ncbi:response regulator transcription factor [Streptomyces sp. JJ36]|nr:response regulator transcription factor [Streptomyces sp. JJ36]